MQYILCWVARFFSLFEFTFGRDKLFFFSFVLLQIGVVVSFFRFKCFGKGRKRKGKLGPTTINRYIIK